MRIEDQEETWAYLAGVMDADGCFMIQKTKETRKKINPSYNIRVRLTQIDRIVVGKIASLFNSNVNIRDGRSKNCKEQYRVTLSAKKAEDFIRKIRPYLQIKKRQADVMLEFQENTYTGHIGPIKQSQETLDYRERLFQLVKDLNQRKVPLDEEINIPQFSIMPSYQEMYGKNVKKLFRKRTKRICVLEKSTRHSELMIV